MKPSKMLALPLKVMVISFLAVNSVFAKTCTWIGGSGSWSVTDNWDENGKPETGDSVVLSTSAAAEIVNDLGAMSLSDITFGGSQAITLKSEGALTLSGVSFAWSGQTLFRLIQDSCTAAVTVDAPIVLTHPGRTNQVAMAGSATTLTLKGDISGGGGIWFSGNSSTVNKVRLSGNNSYVGETIFSFDSLYGDSTTAFGQAGNMIKHINGGSGNLNLTVPGTYNYGYTPHTEPGTALSLSGSGEFTITGPLVLLQPSTVKSSYTISIPSTVTKLTLDGTVSGEGVLRLQGSASTVTKTYLNGENSHGGTIFRNSSLYGTDLHSFGRDGVDVAWESGSGGLYLTKAGVWKINIKFGTESYQSLEVPTGSTIDGKIYAADTSTFGQMTVRSSGDIYVTGGFEFPGQKGFYPLFLNNSCVHLSKSSDISYFYKNGGTDWNGFVQFDAPSNTYGALNLGRTVNVKCGVADALDATKTILWAGNTSAGGGYLDLGGHDQHALALESDSDTTGRCLVSYGGGATLYLDGAAQDYTTSAQIGQGVSLVWNPAGAYVQTVMDRAHVTAGSITVSNGTFRVGGTSTFKNLTAIDVADGATFDLATTASYALNGLKSLTVEDGGTFAAGAGAQGPIGEDAVVTLGKTATLALQEGSTVDVAELWVYENGELKQLEKGEYDHSKVPQITGGTLSVAAGDPPLDEITWSAGGADDRRVTTWANWDGQAHDLASGFVYPTFAAAGTEAVIDGSVAFKGICFGGAAESFALTGTGSIALGDLGVIDESSRTNTIAVPVQVLVQKDVRSRCLTVGKDATLELRAPLTSTETVSVGKGGKGVLNIYAPSTFAGEFCHTGGMISVYAPSNAFGKVADSSSRVFINERDGDYSGIYFYGTTIDHPVTIWGNSDRFGSFCFRGGTNVFNGKVTTGYTFRPRNASGSVAIFNGGTYSSSYLTPGCFGSTKCEWIVRNRPMECREGLELGAYFWLTLETTGNTVGSGGSGALSLHGAKTTIDFRTDYAYSQVGLQLSFAKDADQCQLLLNGHSQRIGTLEEIAGAVGKIDSPSPAVLYLNQNKLDTTLSGVEFTGYASLSKAGAKTVTIDRKMSSKGTVEVTEGTLAFTANGSWRKCAELSISGTGVVSVPAGSVLRVKKIVIDGVEKLGTVGPVGSGADFETGHVTGGLIQGKTGVLLLIR